MAWQDDLAEYIGSYTLAYVPADVVAAMRGSHALGIFFNLDTDPGLHLWTGVNDMPAGIDGVDPDGTVYLGGGQLLNVPTLQILINGKADDVEFGLSGVDPQTAQAIIDELPPVRGKDLRIGLMVLDQYYQPIRDIIQVWTGVASHTSDGMAPVTGVDPRTMTLSLAVVSGSGTRSRPALVTWTPEHQTALWKQNFPTPEEQAAHPRDRFCDNVSRLARGVAPPWPDY